MSSSGTDKKYRKAFLRGYTDFRSARIASRAWGLFNWLLSSDLVSKEISSCLRLFIFP